MKNMQYQRELCLLPETTSSTGRKNHHRAESVTGCEIAVYGYSVNDERNLKRLHVN